MRKSAVLAIFLGLVLAAGGTPLLAQGENAPDFTLTDLQGRSHSLSEYRGKVLFLNFWATWCPPCRVEIPDFIQAYQELRDKGLEILGVSVDRLSPAELREWVGEMKINYPVALADRKILKDYQPGQYIPATIIIDPSGKIRHREVGAMDKDTLLRLFNEFSK